MTVDTPAADAESSGQKASALGALTPVFLTIAAIVLIYIPVLVGAANIWLTNDTYSHGFLVLPCCAAILWLQKDEIKSAVPAPTLWGVIPLLIGLVMETASYILQIRYVGMWSLVPTLGGAILLLHGPALWKICRFSVLFTLFASPISNTLLAQVTGWLQATSSIGSASLMQALGYTLSRHGNAIELPGATLEIANACSGFHSTVSMLAFTCIYAYLFTDSPVKRTILLLVTVPIALTANVLRICVLILAANYGGLPGYHMMHDPAAFAEIFVDFGILVLIGRSLGCDTLRFAPTSAA